METTTRVRRSQTLLPSEYRSHLPCLGYTACWLFPAMPEQRPALDATGGQRGRATARDCPYRGLQCLSNDKPWTANRRASTPQAMRSIRPDDVPSIPTQKSTAAMLRAVAGPRRCNPSLRCVPDARACHCWIARTESASMQAATHKVFQARVCQSIMGEIRDWRLGIRDCGVLCTG